MYVVKTVTEVVHFSKSSLQTLFSHRLLGPPKSSGQESELLYSPTQAVKFTRFLSQTT